MWIIKDAISGEYATKYQDSECLFTNDLDKAFNFVEYNEAYEVVKFLQQIYNDKWYETPKKKYKKFFAIKEIK